MEEKIYGSNSSSSDTSPSSVSEASTSGERYSKEISDIDLDIQTHNQRILAILSETIYKTEIVIFILNFDKFDNEELQDLLSKNIIKEIKEVALTLKPENLENTDYQIITTSQIQELVIYPCPRIMPKLSQLICKILDISKMMQIIKNKVRDMKSSPHMVCLYNYFLTLCTRIIAVFSIIRRIYVDIWVERENQEFFNMMTYLDSLMKLKIKFKNKLYISAAEKLKRDIMARNLNKTNKAIKLKINDASNRLNKEKDVFKTSFDEKEGIIKNLQEKFDITRSDCKNEIIRILLETENEIDVTKECHKSKMEILKEKEDESKEHYECLLRGNLDNENQLRTTRRKVEQELLYWLGQYDKEVGYRQSVLDRLTLEYEAKQRRYEELEEKMRIQEKIYTPLMAQKEEEYQREILQKMTTFLMEHAARVIQRQWRRILNARAEKKRLKKLASKKKKIKDSSVGVLPV